MLLGEPPPTQADLHFRIFDFPVRVSPFFWVIALLIGAGGIGGGPADPTKTLVRVLVIFISILVHELGHAFMQRRYGGRPWITLHGLGGLASCDDCDRSPRSQIIISAAGPMAGFLLALSMGLVVLATGHAIGLAAPSTSIDDSFLQGRGASALTILSLDICQAYWEPLDSNLLNVVVAATLAINILWGLLNLLPIYPLDGGRIAREVLTLSGNPRQGIVRSLWLSVGTAGVVAAYGLARGSLFMLLMFGYLAYSNYRTIQAYESYDSGPNW